LPQSDVAFSKLKDPEGISNWPNGLGRDGARTPMPWSDAVQNGGWIDESWLPVEPSHLALSVQAQLTEPNSVLNRCRRLIALRKQHPALVIGDIKFLSCTEKILAFERIHEDEKLFCAFNMSDQNVAWTHPDGAKVSAADVVYETVEGSAATGRLPSLSGFIAKQNAR